MQDNFRFWVTIVVAISSGCGLFALLVAILDIFAPSPELAKLFETLLHLFTMGVGTVFGLFGGAAIAKSDSPRIDSRARDET